MTDSAAMQLPKLQADAEGAYSQEIERAFNVCQRIIDNPPEEYRLVKQAVLGLVHLSAKRRDLRSRAMLKILQVVRDPSVYRSNPRRYAVHSIACMTYYDKELIGVCTQMFMQLVKPTGENSQYVRKAAFVALSRIGRRYPAFQEPMFPLFMKYYNDSKIKESVLWGIIIGLGRMAQSNALLRSEFASEWIRWCSHRSFRLRWAGIKGLGHACCPIGDVINDENLENQCFEISMAFLIHGGTEGIQSVVDRDLKSCTNEELWKKEEVYLVQYAATQALSLLLRSNPDKWWRKISPVFGELLLNSKIASMIKATVMITYGKIAFYLSPVNPYYTAIKDLLMKLTENENILVSEPATYGLVNFALAHAEIYDSTKALVASKLGAPIEKAGHKELLYFLKTWCKLISKNYTPILNLCSKVISIHSGQDFSKCLVASKVPAVNFGPESADEERKTDQKSKRHHTSGPSPDQIVKQVARDSVMLYELCTQFSTSVLESALFPIDDVTVLDNRSFLDNLRTLILKYSAKSDKSTINQNGLVKLYERLYNLDPCMKEPIVMILKYPNVLDDAFWLSNFKLVILNMTSLRGSSSDVRTISHEESKPRSPKSTDYNPVRYPHQPQYDASQAQQLASLASSTTFPMEPYHPDVWRAGKYPFFPQQPIPVNPNPPPLAPIYPPDRDLLSLPISDDVRNALIEILTNALQSTSPPSQPSIIDGIEDTLKRILVHPNRVELLSAISTNPQLSSLLQQFLKKSTEQQFPECNLFNNFPVPKQNPVTYPHHPPYFPYHPNPGNIAHGPQQHINYPPPQEPYNPQPPSFVPSYLPPHNEPPSLAPLGSGPVYSSFPRGQNFGGNQRPTNRPYLPSVSKKRNRGELERPYH
ncbi:uncharacterized protein LOC126330068 [Schistocerca gregaria]|uniref:uncharacterized protein LOC126330068 n=1 Tax=Schistocerca gregaria TaxID=7010 RepID=UPI00211EA534|nr:uncharacterized protein LOC126330068 [Schistocerca gregaria]